MVYVPFAFGVASFAAATMQTLFVTYYVTLFLRVYRLDSFWFLVGEGMYLVWNSVNDPLFGFFLRGVSVKKRLPSLNWGGILWSLSFALFFVLPVASSPWMVGLHFCICLLLYDTFYSFVLIVHNSLLPDISSDAHERASCNAWSSGFSILGSCSVLGANLLWDAMDIGPFRVFCLVMGFLSLGALQASYFMLKSSGRAIQSEEQRKLHLSGDDSQFTLRSFWADLRAHGNFWVFVGVNLIQMFNCHFNTSLLVIAIARFISPLSSSSLSSASSSYLVSSSALLTLAAVLPHAAVVLLTPVLHRVGLRSFLLGLYAFKVVVGAVGLFLVAPTSSSFVQLAALFLTNKVFTEVICRHGNLVVADLVEEDSALHPQRSSSRSSMYFGANAFFSKPGEALAAVVCYYAQKYDASLYQLLFAIPIACGVAQLLIFQAYRPFVSTEVEKRT